MNEAHETGDQQSDKEQAHVHDTTVVPWDMPRVKPNILKEGHP